MRHISHDTWIHRIVKVAVRPLAKTSVTPNQVTTVRLVTGLAGAGIFAIGGSPWHYFAVILFVFSTLLDRADGELARMTGQSSPRGHIYDIVSDATANALLFIGIGIGLRDSMLGYWSIAMGIVAGIAVATTLLIVMRVENLEGSRAAELSGFAGFDPDDAILLVPLAMLVGLQVPILIAATLIAPIFAACFTWNLRWGLNGNGGAPSQIATAASSSNLPAANATASTGSDHGVRFWG